MWSAVWEGGQKWGGQHGENRTNHRSHAHRDATHAQAAFASDGAQTTHTCSGMSKKAMQRACGARAARRGAHTKTHTPGICTHLGRTSEGCRLGGGPATRSNSAVAYGRCSARIGVGGRAGRGCRDGRREHSDQTHTGTALNDSRDRSLMRSTDALARTTHVHMLRKNGDRPRMSHAVRESSEQHWWGSKPGRTCLAWKRALPALTGGRGARSASLSSIRTHDVD